MPPDTPVTIPVPLPIVATEVLALLHIPPPVIILSVVVLPWHTVITPPIAVGDGFTVIIAVA